MERLQLPIIVDGMRIRKVTHKRKERNKAGKQTAKIRIV